MVLAGHGGQHDRRAGRNPVVGVDDRADLLAHGAGDDVFLGDARRAGMPALADLVQHGRQDLVDHRAQRQQREGHRQRLVAVVRPVIEGSLQHLLGEGAGGHRAGAGRRVGQQLADVVVREARQLGNGMAALGRLAQLAQPDHVLGSVGAAAIGVALRRDDAVAAFPGAQGLDTDATGL